MRLTGRWLVLLLAAVLVTGACGRATVSGGTVRVVASWDGAELDTFRAVVAPFEQRTHIRVDYTSTRDLRGTLDLAIANGNPPDLAGLDGPAHMRELSSTGALKDLARGIDVQAYKSEVAPTFIELGTVDDRLVGAFVKATLKGLLWYDPAAFRRGVPHSWAELGTMAQLSMKGATRQWCVGLESGEASGWPGTDWIELLLLSREGLRTYDRWVEGDLAWTSDPVRRAFESFGQVVAADAVFGGVDGAESTNFADAGEPLFTDPPGCLLMLQGSFMPAFFEARGHQPGVDFDFFPFPDAEAAGVVLGAGDLVGLLTDSPRGAALMEYLLSPEAQRLWVSRGGAISINQSVAEYPNDVVAREARMLSGAAHFRFDGSDLMTPSMSAAFSAAVLEVTRNPSRLDQILADLDSARGQSRGR
jgi:alpha-glucoside transport system substrate-binding protein